MAVIRDRLLSGLEAAQVLNISESSFWALVNRGLIARVDLSGTGRTGRGRKLWRFRESTLQAYVTANERTAGKPPAAAPPAPPVSGADALRAAGWDGESHAPKRRVAK